jgi:hypothetical protein
MENSGNNFTNGSSAGFHQRLFSIIVAKLLTCSRNDHEFVIGNFKWILLTGDVQDIISLCLLRLQSFSAIRTSILREYTRMRDGF